MPGASVTYSDIKQRAVFTQPKRGYHYRWYRAPDGRLYQGQPEAQDDLTTCAEPSPDALTVLAHTGGVKVSAGDKFSVDASGADNEAGQAVGLRTQATETLKQQNTNNCLAYQSGELSAASVETLTYHNQDQLVAIIALDDLGLAAHAGKSTVISTSVAAPASGGNGGGGTAGGETGGATQATGATTKKIASGGSTGATGAGTGTTAGTTATAAPTPSVTAADAGSEGSAAVATAAPAMVAVVNKVLDSGFLRNVCATIIIDIAAGRMPDGVPGSATCERYLEISVQRLANANDLTADAHRYFDQLITKRDLTAPEIRYLIELATPSLMGSLVDPGDNSAPSASRQPNTASNPADNTKHKTRTENKKTEKPHAAKPGKAEQPAPRAAPQPQPAPQPASQPPATSSGGVVQGSSGGAHVIPGINGTIGTGNTLDERKTWPKFKTIVCKDKSVEHNEQTMFACEHHGGVLSASN